MEYLLISSKKDLASQNIKNCIEKYGFDVFEVDKELIQITQDDLPKAKAYIFLSKHRSESGKPTLTVHTPGNLTEDNSFGGNKEEICPCNPILNTLLLRNIFKYNSQYKEKIDIFDVSFEVVHHGPSDLDTPAVFVEIGSSEKEWVIKDSGEIIAKSIVDTIEQIKNIKDVEGDRVIGFGGGHYAPRFTNLALNGHYVGYIVPKYASVSDKVLEQMINKQEFDYIAFDWKGLKGDDKRRYIKFFEEKGVIWKKI
jgi:D-aminoacyl-tRNA deacylase